MAAAAEHAMRKDARRSRDALLEAARTLFAESGEVVMHDIARRAGIGRATLYRHFPDHGAVALAIFSDELEGLERLAAESAGRPDAFFAVLRAVAGVQARFQGLAECLRGVAARGADENRLKERFVELIEQPLRDARAGGLVRNDLSIDDVFLVIAMVSGALERRHEPRERPALVERALTLAFEGLAPRTSSARCGP